MSTMRYRWKVILRNLGKICKDLLPKINIKNYLSSLRLISTLWLTISSKIRSKRMSSLLIWPIFHLILNKQDFSSKFLLIWTPSTFPSLTIAIDLKSPRKKTGLYSINSIWPSFMMLKGRDLWSISRNFLKKVLENFRMKRNNSPTSLLKVPSLCFSTLMKNQKTILQK